MLSILELYFKILYNFIQLVNFWKLFKKYSTSFKDLHVLFFRALKSTFFFLGFLGGGLGGGQGDFGGLGGEGGGGGGGHFCSKYLFSLFAKNKLFIEKTPFLVYNFVIYNMKNKVNGEQMEIELKENERIDDLEFKNLKIIQNKEGFCFGIDSILLTDFAKNIRQNSKIIDLGTGTGIIPILLYGKTKNTEFVGVEIQKEVAEMAKRSVKLNKLEEKIDIINMNILNLNKKYERGSFDAVTTNPPYKKINTGIINNNDKKVISRHEITASLDDFIKTASFLLKDFGEFYMVHRPDRLVDIFSVMRKYKIEPKKIKFVYPNKNKKTNLVLIKGVKNGRQFLEFENNLYVYNEDGNYTEEILKIYNKI